MVVFVRREDEKGRGGLGCSVGELIKESNQVIDGARFNLTLTQRRLFLAAVSQIRVEDEDFRQYEIPLSVFGYNTSFYRVIREVRDLMSRTMEIETERGRVLVNPFSSVEHLKDRGLLLVRFDPALKPYYLGLQKNFTVYPFKVAVGFGKVVSIDFYRLLKKWEKVGRFEVDLKRLRFILGLSEKRKYAEIKKNVLIPAIEEVNEKSDVEVEKVEEVKGGRAVERLVFFFRSKEGKTAVKVFIERGKEGNEDGERERTGEKAGVEATGERAAGSFEVRIKAEAAEVEGRTGRKREDSWRIEELVARMRKAVGYDELYREVVQAVIESLEGRGVHVDEIGRRMIGLKVHIELADLGKKFLREVREKKGVFIESPESLFEGVVKKLFSLKEFKAFVEKIVEEFVLISV